MENALGWAEEVPVSVTRVSKPQGCIPWDTFVVSAEDPRPPHPLQCHTAQTRFTNLPFPFYPARRDRKKGFPPKSPACKASTRPCGSSECCRANTPALTLPCSSRVVWFVLFCGFLFFFFPSDGVKVRPTRHFIAVPDENSPGDSRGARSGVTEAGVTRLASQAVPVLGGPGWPGDSSGTGRALPAAVAARTARPERARESDE